MRTARLRHVQPWELPFRLGQLGTRIVDRVRPPWDVPPGPAPRWPWGPVTDVPGTLPEADPADPRSGWEAGRLQTLPDVDDAVPGLTGSTPEDALRLVSLVRIASRRAGLRTAIARHADWIARHPSEGTSANNHRVAELGALALAATVLPDLGAAWRRQAERLPAVLEAQVHADGVGVEQSPSYLAYDLEWALIARRCGIGGMDGAMARAGRWLAAILDSQGHAPDLGDDDGGRVIATVAGPEDRYVRSVTGAVAAALGVAAPLGWAPDARSVALGLADAPGRAIGPSGTFPHGGYTVLRERGARLVFDHGPLGGAFLAAHGHADALAVWLSVGGRPVLGARGTGRYLGDPAVRRFHRGTLAHATVVVDGADQSVQDDDPFLWRTRAAGRLEAADATSATAVLDGRVVHRRTVRLEDDHLELVDVLGGTGRHHVAVVLPFAPHVAPRFVPDPRVRVRSVTGGAFPGPGWHSPSYGRWVEATTVLLEAHVRLPVRLRTVLPFG